MRWFFSLGLCVLGGALAASVPPLNKPIDPDDVKTVHVVQSNHLDVGFADYASRIMDRYLTGETGTGAPPLPRNRSVYYESFLLSALNTSATLRALGGDAAFKYMTHSYILDVMLACPSQHTPYPAPSTHPNDTLRCVTDANMATIAAGIRSGDLYWHAFPHNAQPELLNAVTASAVMLAPPQALARHYGVPPPKFMSQRDVPGFTRSMVPLLAAAGVTGVTVGVNDGTPPPLLPSTVDCYSGYRQVRTPFVWRDVGTNTSVLADFHPGGYGGITGGIDPATHMPYYDRDGTLCGCVGWPGLSDVMCYGWRGDNYGPAGDNETQVDFKLWGAAFPNAHVLASSPDTFFDKLQPFADELPVVTSEIGDTWMYGTASDPFKLAAMRSMMRHFAACETAGNCTVDKEPGIAAFKLAVQKLPEHTWGGCGCEHLKISEPTTAWTADDLAAAIHDGQDPYFSVEERTWRLQRQFIFNALTALGDASALKAAIVDDLNALQAPFPSPGVAPPGYTAVPATQWGAKISLSSGVVVAMDTASGAVAHYADAAGRVWTAPSSPLAVFMYRTHAYDEAVAYHQAYNYNHGGPHPYREPIGWPSAGMNSTQTKAAQLRCSVVNMWATPAAADTVSSLLVQLQLPAEASALGYGAPSTVWLNLTAGPDAATLLDVMWAGQRPSRLPSSVWLELRPSLPDPSAPWRLLVDKVGLPVDAADVVAKGGGALHGVDPSGGVTFRQQPGTPWLAVSSSDAALVAPGANTSPWNFTAFDNAPVNPRNGAAFNLYNNLYTTNYVLWYPSLSSDTAQDSSSRFRFTVRTGVDAHA